MGRTITHVVLVASMLLATSCSRPGDSCQDPTSAFRCLPEFTHIGIVVFENAGFDRVFGPSGRLEAPYLNGLADRFGLATSYYGVAHSSLPNYVAMISGQPPNEKTRRDCPLYDCLYPRSASTIADQLEATGHTWKAYFEGMPEPCAHGREGEPDPYPSGEQDDRRYATRHNPFVYFRSIVEDPARCAAHDVPYAELGEDLENGTLPDFFFIVPDLCHNGHECLLDTADSWAAEALPPVLAYPPLADGGVLFVTFDEAEVTDTSGCCEDSEGGHVGTIVVSPRWLREPGFSSSIPHNHYSLLRTVETAWGLDPLGHAQDDDIEPMVEFFRLVSR